MPSELPDPPLDCRAVAIQGGTRKTRAGDSRLVVPAGPSAGFTLPGASFTLPGAGFTLNVIRLLFLSVFAVLSASATFANATFASGLKPQAGLVISAPAAEQRAAATVPEEDQEHGVSQNAIEITRVFGLPITNSMLVSWIVALGLIIFAWVATRRMKQVPEGAQNLFESLVEGLYTFLEGLLGP
ncbi:MAG: hypothetical protein ACREAC_32740, partial [Blastocatellia bacterium]